MDIGRTDGRKVPGYTREQGAAIGEPVPLTLRGETDAWGIAEAGLGASAAEHAGADGAARVAKDVAVDVVLCVAGNAAESADSFVAASVRCVARVTSGSLASRRSVTR